MHHKLRLDTPPAVTAEVIFSDTALLEVEEGCAYLRFRVADMSLASH